MAAFSLYLTRFYHFSSGIKTKSSKPIKAADSSAGKPSAEGKSSRRQKPKPNVGNHWQARVENLSCLCQWYFYSPWEGITEKDLLHFVAYGDVVAQVYFVALRKAGADCASRNLPHSLQFPNNFDDCLFEHIKNLNEYLCEIARAGSLPASQELWDQALKLTNTFSELALKKPGLFKAKSRQSLYMPSIRSKNPKFTANAKEIAAAIELSSETVGARLHDNRTLLGALTAKLIGECVDEIIKTRRQWERIFRPEGWSVIWPTHEQIKPFLKFKGKNIDAADGVLQEMGKVHLIKTNEDKLNASLRFFCMLNGCGIDRIHFLALNELTKYESKKWWKEAIEPMVEAKFPALLKEPLWNRELVKISNGTEKDMLHELKKYCAGKVSQFASS